MSPPYSGCLRCQVVKAKGLQVLKTSPGGLGVECSQRGELVCTTNQGRENRRLDRVVAGYQRRGSLVWTQGDTPLFLPDRRPQIVRTPAYQAYQVVFDRAPAVSRLH